MNLPILPTSMVGSYAMPGWLERLKTDYFARRISRHDLDEIYDTSVKAAIKDQEIAGIDIVTDGESRRDNNVDYFLERFPGVQIDRSSKKFYYDFYDSVEVVGELLGGPVDLDAGEPLQEVIDVVVAARLAVGNDVDAGDFLVLDCRFDGS